jgi:hypothetical protein
VGPVAGIATFVLVTPDRLTYGAIHVGLRHCVQGTTTGSEANDNGTTADHVDGTRVSTPLRSAAAKSPRVPSGSAPHNEILLPLLYPTQPRPQFMHHAVDVPNVSANAFYPPEGAYSVHPRSPSLRGPTWSARRTLAGGTSC